MTDLTKEQADKAILAGLKENERLENSELLAPGSAPRAAAIALKAAEAVLK